LRQNPKLPAPDRGSALVETAVVLPVLVFLFLAVAQLGMLVNAKLTVSEAAREAAREFVLHEGDGGYEKAGLRAAAIMASLPYRGSFDAGDAAHFSITVGGEDATVMVRYGCPVIVPGIKSLLVSGSEPLGGEFSLAASATFRREVLEDD
jgi:hypothetical protein